MSGRFIPFLGSAASVSAPLITSSCTYDPQGQLGEYVQRDETVRFWLRLIVTGKDRSMAGFVLIGGLPTISKPNGIDTMCATSYSVLNLGAGFSQVTAFVVAGTAQLAIRRSGTLANASNFDPGSIPNSGFKIDVQGEYLIGG